MTRVLRSEILGFTLQRMYAGPESTAPYLIRIVLPRTAWGCLMIHVFRGPDEDRACHTHTFDFWTLPLNKGYDEEVLDTETGSRRTHHVPKWRWSERRAEHTHRVIGPEFPVVTMVWVKQRPAAVRP